MVDKKSIMLQPGHFIEDKAEEPIKQDFTIYEGGNPDCEIGFYYIDINLGISASYDHTAFQRAMELYKEARLFYEGFEDFPILEDDQTHFFVQAGGWVDVSFHKNGAVKINVPSIKGCLAVFKKGLPLHVFEAMTGLKATER